MTLLISIYRSQRTYFTQIVRAYSTENNGLPNIGTTQKVDPNMKHYRKIKLSGYNVNYIKIGHGPHAVFCYPGLLGAMRTHLSELIANFANHTDTYTFYSWDQPGYGQSRPPKRNFNDESLQEDADISLQLLKILGHEKYSILGWSGGALSALLFATQNQEIIRKLIVWGVFAYVDKEDADKFEWFKNSKNWRGKMQHVLVEEYGSEFVNENWSQWMEIMKRIYTHHEGELCTQSLHKIQCPTYIIHGAQDLIVQEKHPQYLHKNIKNSELLIMEKGKHNLQLKYPNEFFSAVHNFLQAPHSKDL